MSQRVATRLRESSSSQRLLQLSFPFIAFAELGDAVFAVMKRCKDIPLAYLQRYRWRGRFVRESSSPRRRPTNDAVRIASLAASQQLYDLCPIEVKRQIWIADGDVFRREVCRRAGRRRWM